MGTFVIGAILICAVIGIVRYMINNKRQGKSIQCGGDCKQCGGGCH